MSVSAHRFRFFDDLRFYRARIGRQRSFLATLRSRGFWLLQAHRYVQSVRLRKNLFNPFWWLRRLLVGPVRYLVAIACKSEILGDCSVDEPVRFSDRGYLMLGAREIGGGTVIHDHVTAGYAVSGGRADRPTIGERVWIGPNCVVAGQLHVGDGATLLGGTVLTYSIPPGAVVRGNPARVIRHNFDNSALRLGDEREPELTL